MSLRLWVSILLRHTKVDYTYKIGVLRIGTTDEEVVWLDVAIDKVLFVYCLYASEHLSRNHDYGLDGESTTAEIE